MSETIYALYPVFKVKDDLREALIQNDERRHAAQEIENLYKSWEGRVHVRGTYSTVGFRADADLMLWLHGSSPHDLQHALVEFRRTTVGRLTDLTWTFMGAVKPAEFTADHAPAFVKGTPPETFLCVYPFVRTPEWYLLPREERGELLREHGGAGREFPEVLANTTSAFGLGDWEWILAFEAERADSLVDCIRRLRETKARLYTKVEVPFVTGDPQVGRRRARRPGVDHGPRRLRRGDPARQRSVRGGGQSEAIWRRGCPRVRSGRWATSSGTSPACSGSGPRSRLGPLLSRHDVGE